ncbi:MAG: hypothetical protein ACRDTT_21340, partial [Pseudonocardiaceae bacterium]
FYLVRGPLWYGDWRAQPCADCCRRRVEHTAGRPVTADPGQAEERDGNVVVITPCDCRSEVVLDRAQVQVSRWQACPGCRRRWRLYVLGSGRAVWAEVYAEPPPARRGINGLRKWLR